MVLSVLGVLGRSCDAEVSELGRADLRSRLPTALRSKYTNINNQSQAEQWCFEGHNERFGHVYAGYEGGVDRRANDPLCGLNKGSHPCQHSSLLPS